MLHTEGSVFSTRYFRNHGVTNTPFKSVYHAISYYNWNKPLRIKSINLHMESHNRSDDSNRDKWTFLCQSLWRVLTPIKDERRCHAFVRYFLDVTRPGRSQSELAEEMGYSQAQVSKDLNRVLDLVEEEFRSVGLIPDPEENESEVDGNRYKYIPHDGRKR